MRSLNIKIWKMEYYILANILIHWHFVRLQYLNRRILTCFVTGRMVPRHRWIHWSFFFKNGPIPASFCSFSFFSYYNFNTNWKNVDGVLGIWTRGRRMAQTKPRSYGWSLPALHHKRKLCETLWVIISATKVAKSLFNCRFYAKKILFCKRGHSWPIFLYFCLFRTVDSKCSI